jgi:hypothetical protein
MIAASGGPIAVGSRAASIPLALSLSKDKLRSSDWRSSFDWLRMSAEEEGDARMSIEEEGDARMSVEEEGDARDPRPAHPELVEG